MTGPVDNDMNPNQKPPMRRWLKVLLAGSLALNLAVVGLAAGAALRHAGKDRDWRRPAPSVGSLLFKELDRDTKAELRQRAADGHGNYRARRRAESQAVIEHLRDVPFEAGKLAVILKAQSQSRFDFQLSVQEAWLGSVAAMSDEERAEYADQLEEMLRRKPGKGSHRDGGRDGHRDGYHRGSH